MQEIFKKDILPHLAVMVAFVAVTLLFFYPLVQGKYLKQPDIINWEGMAKEINDYRKETGNEPLWTNSMFGGMPAFQISVLYPTNLFSKIDRFFIELFPGPSSYIFMAMVSFYFLLVTLKLKPVLSAIGAFAFAFSSYNIIIIEAGHNSKANAIAYMAIVVIGVLLTYRKKYLTGAAITTLGVAMQVNANHLQITYYLLMLLLIYGIYELYTAFKNKELPHFAKATAILAGAAILGVLPNTASLLVTQEYGAETTRGKSELTLNAEKKTSGLDKDYATAWSYGIGETMTLMIPDFKGGGSAYIGNDKAALKEVDPQFRQVVTQMDRYFGDQPFTSGPVYIGAIICFLFILGLLILKGTLKWWLFTATILSIMLSWGRNFMPLTDFFLDYVPGYNKFRAVSMTLVIAQFAIPLLGFLTLKEIIQTPAVIKEKVKHFYTAIGLTGGLCLLMYIMPGLFNDFFKTGEYNQLMDQLSESNWPAAQAADLMDNIEAARKSIFKADALRSAILIILAAIFIFLYSRKTFSLTVLIAGLGILIVFDMWSVNKRYLNDDSFTKTNIRKHAYLPTQADLQIMQDPDPNFRVFNVAVNTFNDASTSYFHKSIGGYHGAKLKRYQELIEHQISKNNMDVLNMLNTKYFIVPGQDKQPMSQRNPRALGNAWFVDEHKLVANADSEIVALSDFEPSQLAIVDQRFSAYVQDIPLGEKEGEINLTEYRPDYLKYQANTEKDALAVFSEIYYNDEKGWKAYIDGQRVDHIRVNYVLRALKVPAGEHTVEFKFEPQTYHTGLNIALAGSILSLLFIGFAGFKAYKNHGE
jgi:hypothetical protein